MSLIELSLWRLPDTDEILVQPRILARTVQIERAVVRIENTTSERNIVIEPALPSASRRSTLTADEFYERLGTNVEATLPARLQAFLADVEGLGVYADQKGMLTLRWRNEEGREFNLGVIDSYGRFYTEQCHLASAQIGRLEASQRYKVSLAKLIPGGGVEQTDKTMGVRLVIPTQFGVLSHLLDHAQEWQAALGDYIADLRADA